MLEWSYMPRLHPPKNKLALSGFIVLILLGVGAYIIYQANQKPQGRVACSMIAKQCPDGSYVSRKGPNCEFSSCPGVK